MKESKKQRLAKWGFGILVAAMVGVLATALWHLPEEPRGLAEEVDARLEDAGTSNPVTAVLLNFRSYDTLLEIAVLLLAVLGAQVLAGDEADLAVVHREVRLQDQSAGNPVLDGFVRLAGPTMILVAGYLLWAGGHAPGGAFQAGAVLAALGILLLLTGAHQRLVEISPAAERGVLVAGVGVFLGVGIGMVLVERRFLEYPVPGAKWLMLLIETFAMVSIAAIVVALFRGGRLIRNVCPPTRNSESKR